MIINEFTNDWEQQSKFGSSPITAMTNFISTNKADIAQSKKVGTKDQWYYINIILML